MSYKDKYLKYKKKYINLKNDNTNKEKTNIMTGGYIPDTLIGYEMVLSASQVLKYNINCGPNLSYNIPNGIYNSYDSKYSNYNFKLRSCKEDFNGYYYLTIYKKSTFSIPTSPIMNNNLIMLYIKYTANVFSIYINMYDYVYNLKNIIYKKIGIIPVQQQLAFKNIILEDTRLISYYNIIQYDTIVLYHSQTVSTYPNVPMNIIPNQPISIFTKLSTKKSYGSSSSSSSSSDSDYKSRKTRNSIKTKTNETKTNETKPINSANKTTNITNSDTDDTQKINLNTNANYINWFIFNERKDHFNYWEKSKDNNKIEKLYQEYLETAKLINSSVLTTIEPKIFVDYKNMKFITINIDDTTTNRKIKRIFLEKIKISDVKWMLEEGNNEWKKMLDPSKIEELYQVFTIYKTYFIKNPIFFLEDDTFIDFKNMVLIVKDTKKKIKRE
jgi:hypothetical protein